MNELFYTLLSPSELREVKLQTNVRNVRVQDLTVKELLELYDHIQTQTYYTDLTKAGGVLLEFINRKN